MPLTAEYVTAAASVGVGFFADPCKFFANCISREPAGAHQFRIALLTALSKIRASASFGWFNESFF